MNERIRNLISGKRLQEESAPDAEIRGLWANALNMLEDASLQQRAAPFRLASAYDAGRMAAHTIVRSNGFLVKAPNHHEMTLSVAGELVSPRFMELVIKLQAVRLRRTEVEYGWRQTISTQDMQDALECAREIIDDAERYLMALNRGIEPR